MKHQICVSLIPWLILINYINTTPNTLDISDYTFHYTNYHYTLSSLSTESTTIYNHKLQTNFTIHFSSTISLIINNITINILNDDELDEISTIHPLNIHSNSLSNHKRSLQEDEWDEEEEELPKIREGIRHGMSWIKANTYCKTTRRGHLVTIHDEDENAEMADMCKTLGFARWHCWIGLMRPFKHWIDKTEVDFTYWLPKQPSNWGGNENCVEIYSEDNEKYMGWNDLQCSMTRSFICEKEQKKEEEEWEKECNECNKEEMEHRRALLNCNKCHKGHQTSSEKERNKERKESQKHWWREKQKARDRMNKKERKESRRIRAQRKERRRRQRWRAHLRELRRKHREELMDDYKREQQIEKRRDSGYRLLDKLIGASLGFSHGLMGRRRMSGDRNGSYVDMMARCKVMRGVEGIYYEICVNYNVGDVFMSIDIRFVEEMVKKRGGDRIDFRRSYSMERMEEEDDDDVEDGDMLGYIVWKYDLMDWHTFKSNEDRIYRKYEYGEYKELNGYMHYFDEYELYFNNNKGIGLDGIDEEYVECSKDIMYLPFRMCMKQVIDEDKKDTVLYFEGNEWEKYTFHYNDDEIWDEMTTIYAEDDVKWIKKCSFKLLIAKICIEQFHIDDSRASIKFLSKQI